MGEGGLIFCLLTSIHSTNPTIITRPFRIVLVLPPELMAIGFRRLSNSVKLQICTRFRGDQRLKDAGLQPNKGNPFSWISSISRVFTQLTSKIGGVGEKTLAFNSLSRKW